MFYITFCAGMRSMHTCSSPPIQFRRGRTISRLHDTESLIQQKSRRTKYFFWFWSRKKSGKKERKFVFITKKNKKYKNYEKVSVFCFRLYGCFYILITSSGTGILYFSRRIGVFVIESISRPRERSHAQGGEARGEGGRAQLHVVSFFFVFKVNQYPGGGGGKYP